MSFRIGSWSFAALVLLTTAVIVPMAACSEDGGGGFGAAPPGSGGSGVTGGGGSVATGGDAPGGAAPGGGAQGGGGAGGGSPCEGTGDCAECKQCAADDACASAVANCSGVNDCIELDACVASCDGAADCIRVCAAGYPGGLTAYLPLAECLLCQSCASLCSGCELMQCLNGVTDPSETDVDCGGEICGACQLGGACLVGDDCASGACADGVCCTSACDGLCEACTADRTGDADGTCAPIPAIADPDDECADEGVDSCGLNGLCDGAGDCALYAEDTACGDPQDCAGGVETHQDLCDGAGQCVDGGSEQCEPYACAELSCWTSCTTEAECDAESYCVGNPGTCQPRQGNGASCSDSAECLSDSCVDGYCCNTACDGSCQACSQAKTGMANGTCAAVPSGNDPDSECQAPAGDSCNGLGACRCHDGQQNGGESDIDCGGECADCTQGKTCNGAGDCVSTNCVDGYCCDTSCTSTCFACAQAKTGTANGTCAAVPNGADPDSECQQPTGEFCNGAGACRCHDTLKNGTETDVDCGGECADCAQGKACNVGGDCISTNCVDGYCCNTSCATTCIACSLAKTGVADGTCAVVRNGTDPDNECQVPAGEFCNGAGACRCHDTLKNGTETDVDCGGECADCAQGKTCNVGGDCISTNCVDGYCCNTSCATTCIACALAKTGVANGTCAVVPNGTDPDSECQVPAGEFCNGAGACRCHDTLKNGTETDVDCGGECSPCAQGRACLAGTDCQNGLCVDGFCCASACSGFCQGCAAALTGHPNGECWGFSDTDPQSECQDPAADVCRGGECRCHNGIQDGTETDVDCGGTYCNKCPNDYHCGPGGNSNCESGNCCSCCGNNVCKPAGNCANYSYPGCPSC